MSANCINKITINGAEVGCTRCDACRQHKINDFVGRAHLELEASVQFVCLTLTYADPENPCGAPKPLAEEDRSFEDVRRMLKRMRKRFPLRYMVSSEYGEKMGRFHHHIALFLYRKMEPLPEGKNFQWREWPHGHVYIRPEETGSAITYIAKYLLKPVQHYDRNAGKPKRSGAKRYVVNDPMPSLADLNQKKRRRELLSEEELQYELDRKQKLRYSQRPLFGTGPSQRDAIKTPPLVRMARERIKQGMPFDRSYKVDTGVYTKGTKTFTKQYFMGTQLTRAAYEAHRLEYYKLTGKGDPPIAFGSVKEGDNSLHQKRVIHKLVFGEAMKEVTQNDLAYNPYILYPMPYGVEPNKKTVAKHFEKAEVRGNITLYKKKNGVYLTQVRHMIPRSTIGVRTWLVRDKKDLGRVLKEFRAQRGRS